MKIALMQFEFGVINNVFLVNHLCSNCCKRIGYVGRCINLNSCLLLTFKYFLFATKRNYVMYTELDLMLTVLIYSILGLKKVLGI